jgi:hypothetical protein
MSLRPFNPVLNAELHRQGKAGYGWLSINRYGAICLNTNRVMFGDVDAVEDPMCKRKTHRYYTEEETRASLEKVAAEQNLAFRFYRTYAGFRLMEVSRLHPPADRETLNMLASLGCDKAFIKLTWQQAVFRSRLTPKPWRAESQTTRFQRSDLCVMEYLRTRRWNITELIAVIGEQPKQLNPEIDFILALHDAWCCGSRDQPLA